MYLYKKNNEVLHFTDKEEATRLYGLGEPDMEITEAQFEKANGLLRVIDGEIFIGNTVEEQLKIDQESVRERRNHLLTTVVDKMQGVLRWQDLSEDRKSQWAEYRRALLDITLQPEFNTEPLKVKFPEQPEVD